MSTTEHQKFHRSDWGSSVAIEDGLWRVRLDNPQGALQVNSYVHRAGGVLSVVDPGWPWTLDALEAALSEMGLASSLREVDIWLYTHTHVDHMGAAALLERRAGGVHRFWERVAPHIDRWHAYQDRVRDWRPWVREHFTDEERDELLARIEASIASREVSSLLGAYGPAALERVQPFALEETIGLGGGLELECVDASGHDPYHIALYSPDRGWLFSGDVALAVPTPLSRSMGDDLGMYRETLSRLEGLDATLLLPGHGMQRRGNVEDSFARSRGFVERYRAGVRTALERAGRPLTLGEIGCALSPSGAPLEPLSRWLAHLALVDTHLEELVEEGLCDRLCEGGSIDCVRGDRSIV
jgi:glyoxylase-like metal-dependent hydrolase (beta-lactamase superfamily II)